MDRLTTRIGSGDPSLEQRLSDELDKHNTNATSGTPAAEELTVSVEDNGVLVAGASGWTWGEAAGIGMMWVDEARRSSGLGRSVLDAFEVEARRRGCMRIFTTSFTFQAPEFYKKAGYVEIFRWQGVPSEGRDDVHMLKDLR